MKTDWPHAIAQYTSNLVTVYQSATKADIRKGKAWYREARWFAFDLARKHSVTLNVAAGVIAALSPGKEWTKNKDNANSFLESYHTTGAGVLTRLDLATYGAGALVKAYAIVNGAPIAHTLHGKKTTAFYRAIVAPKKCCDVVIDGHAKSAALGIRIGTDSVRVHDHEYQHFESAYRAASEVLGLRPNELQAIIWLIWKRFPVGYTVKPIVEVAA